MQYCNVGFILGNTLTEFGHVARGVCRVDALGRLSQITERTKVYPQARVQNIPRTERPGLIFRLTLLFQ